MYLQWEAGFWLFIDNISRQADLSLTGMSSAEQELWNTLDQAWNEL